MLIHYIIQSIFVIVGILSLGISIFNPEWFFTAHNAQFIVKNAGRKRTRLFYAVLGIVMIAAGIYFFLSVYQLEKNG